MRINTNIQAIDAQRNMLTTQNSMSKSIEKLSSGLRINRAADDAAGLSISEKLRAQVRGLAQAQRNAQDGISMIQTAEGALTEVHDMMQRMRELSIQASNDTLSSQDSAAINTEVQQLRAEVDSIRDRTKFNGKALLTGSLLTTLGGATATDLVVNDAVGAAVATAVDVAGARSGVTYTFSSAAANTITLTRSGDSVAQTIAIGAIAANGTQTLDFSSLGVKVTLASAAGETAANLVTGLTAAANDTIVTTGTGSANFQIGANATDSLNVSFSDVSIAALALTTSLDNFNTTQNVTNAQAMITALDTAIQSVSTTRAGLGARQNRLEHTIASLGVTHENISASESRIRDADIEYEMTQFTKLQILQQAGTAILAQANQSPQTVLSLLR
ncbi:MAG: flagellin [Chloroflexota bacterium]